VNSPQREQRTVLALVLVSTWAKGLTERRDPEAAAMCLEIADAAEQLLAASEVHEATLDDVLNGAVTGQMMHADRVERGDVERLMTKATRRRG